MIDEDKLILITAFLKWANGEPVSYADAERLFAFITGQPLHVSSPQPEDVAHLKSEANKRWQAQYMAQ